MKHEKCLLNARKGDEVELRLPGDRTARLSVIGTFRLRCDNNPAVPVLAVPRQVPSGMITYYHYRDVLWQNELENFPKDSFCIPLHIYYLDYQALRIFKKPYEKN